MKYTQGKMGRVFVVRLEDGDRLPKSLETFARENNLLCGMCILLGGIRDGGKLVVGPEDAQVMPVAPLIHILQGVHEILAVGTIFPDEDNEPRLHMHAALGREGKTRAGCIRPGIEAWKVGEVIVLEIVDTTARRRDDKNTGFSLLEP